MPEDDFDPWAAASHASGGVSAAYDTSMLSDPEEFMFKHMRTLDPHDKVSPIKPLPDLPALRQLLRVFLEEDRILIPKSRQMQATWMACGFATWLAMSTKGSMVFMVSRKEDDAGFSRPLSLLARCFFIYSNLPESMQIPKTKGLQPPSLGFPGHYSAIMGLSQDSDALRQQTASLIVWDEMAFQERAAAAYKATMPTIQGGGKIIGISTPNGKSGNLFYHLVHDEEMKE